MIYGYARVSTDGQSVDTQIDALTAAGAVKVFREVASGAKTDRAQLRRLLDQLTAGDVVLVTRLDRLARSTLDLLHTLRTVADKGAGFRSLADTWADTTTPHGRLMLTVLGGLAEFERELIRVRTGREGPEPRLRGKVWGGPSVSHLISRVKLKNGVRMGIPASPSPKVITSAKQQFGERVRYLHD